jgi:hypothetical protein
MTSPTPREALEAERRECQFTRTYPEEALECARNICLFHRGVLHGIELAERSVIERVVEVLKEELRLAKMPPTQYENKRAVNSRRKSAWGIYSSIAAIRAAFPESVELVGQYGDRSSEVSDVERNFHKHDNCTCHISPPCGYCTDCEICGVDESSIVGVFIDELISKAARYDALQAKVSEALEYAESDHDLDSRQEIVAKFRAILSDTSQPTKEH